LRNTCGNPAKQQQQQLIKSRFVILVSAVARQAVSRRSLHVTHSNCGRKRSSCSVSPYLHCPYDVVDWEGGQQVNCKPACQVPLGNGPVICDEIASQFVLHKARQPG
jgi:hypothetical protein